MLNKKFSGELESWLKSKEPKTFAQLEKVFGDRSFGILFLILMAFPALPIPTGGISHVLEILTMIVAVQMMFGMTQLWIPARWSKRELPNSFVKKALPLIMRRVRWLEKYSRVRGQATLENPWFLRFAGLSVLVCTLAAFSAVPFSGLDTLPSIGVVIMALALILSDIAFFIIGLFIGLLGLVLEVTVGAALIVAIKRFMAHGTADEKIWFAAFIVLLIAGILIRHRRKK